MNENQLINEISKGVEFIGELTYRNFLNSFNYSEREFNDATKLEASISALFLFDYMVSSKQVTQDFRKNFYTKCTDDLVERFAIKLQNDNLIHLIDHRYGSYAKIPMKSGDKWQQSLHNLLEINLKGTKGKKSIEKINPITISDAFQEMPLKMQFIKEEIGNSYRTAKIVEELFNGKNISEAIYTIKNLESKTGQIEQKKRKEGCYIATMVYRSCDANEVLVLRAYRDNVLALTLIGRLFIKSYYFFSPTVVRLFKNNEIVNRFAKRHLGHLVVKLKKNELGTIKNTKI